MTTLTLRSNLPGRVDMTGILPATMAGMSVTDIANLPILHDGQALPLGELFDIQPGDSAPLVIRCDRPCLDFLGASMDIGHLIVEGPAGDFAGHGLRGGELILRGGAGDFAASGMKSGLIHIEGRAGDWLGAARIGDRNGMAGGVVTVAGSVGDRAGDRMRRGLILIRGDAGDYCGGRLLAGTIAVAGACGAMAGLGLRRGSLILARAPAALPATFNDAGLAELSYLGLLRRHAESLLPGVVPATARARRFIGDLAFGGKGEILVAA